MSYTLYQPTPEKRLADQVYRTDIDGLYYLTYPLFPDERGLFTSFYKIPHLNQALGTEFVAKQFNFSYSQTNVIRGMHAEGWNKLVTVLQGKALCVLADIRPESPTFLQKEYFEFGLDPHGNQSAGLFITQGIANSICAIEGPVGYFYAVDLLYEDRDKSGDQAISIYDPDLAIEWPIDQKQAIVSERDRNSITLKELYPTKL